MTDVQEKTNWRPKKSLLFTFHKIRSHIAYWRVIAALIYFVMVSAASESLSFIPFPRSVHFVNFTIAPTRAPIAFHIAFIVLRFIWLIAYQVCWLNSWNLFSLIPWNIKFLLKSDLRKHAHLILSSNQTRQMNLNSFSLYDQSPSQTATKACK